jgi:hypothetical protein
MRHTDKRHLDRSVLPVTATCVPAPLSPHWAFVVQLREGSAFSPEGMQGRVEHIVSGEAMLFSSLEEVRAFMEHALAAQRREAHHADS